jgi:mannose-6-phosphate isomerase-like protein (cupin superfamily)
MKKKAFFLFFAWHALALHADTAIVISHHDLPSYGYSQNKLSGICTAQQGANEIEVWHAHLGSGDHTPLHKHDCEEVFIFIKGHGKVNIGGEDVYFAAPCTVIIPPHIEHEVFNLSDEPTDHYTILRIGSTIWDHHDHAMTLPWRQ